MWQPQGFYNQYVLRTPVLLSGEESIRSLYNYPAAKIAVVHGASFADADFFSQAFPKKEVRLIRRSWTGEPDMDGIQDTVRELEKFAPDTIIAVGGGSVMDGTKLCRIFYEFPYYRFGGTRLSGELFRTHFIVVPTTVGSGAEVSSAAVFLDRENGRKDMVVLHELQPEVVVYDKRYIEHTPTPFLITSAMDAMAHMLEGYVSKLENHFMDMMAEMGVSVLCEELSKYRRGEKDQISCRNLQYAGYVGGLVQNHCIVGAAHAIAHQLTQHGYSHSEAIALLLPSVVRVNSEWPEIKAKYDRIADRAKLADVHELLALLQDVCQFAGIHERREKLKELLIQLSREAKFCDNVKSDKGGKGNPVEITDDYIQKIIRDM